MNLLTGLSHDYVVGNSSSVFVPRRALVDTLVLFSLHSADVHLQCPGVGPHGHVGVVVDVKVGPISCPRETDSTKKKTESEKCCVSVLGDDKLSVISQETPA